MTTYKKYLIITQAVENLLDTALAISNSCVGLTFPYSKSDQLKLLESLMFGNDLRIEWEKKIQNSTNYVVKVLYPDYAAQRDNLITTLKEGA